MAASHVKLRRFYIALCAAQLVVTGMGLALAYQVERSYSLNIAYEKSVNAEHQAINELEAYARSAKPESVTLDDSSSGPSQLSQIDYASELFLKKAQNLLDQSDREPNSPLVRSQADLRALISEMGMVAEQSRLAREAGTQHDEPLFRARLTYADRSATRVLTVLGSINQDMSHAKDEMLLQEGIEAKVTHKNVCRIHELSRSSGVPYISMEFVEGETLLSRLRRTSPLPWHDALKIVQQICAGLREAHMQGVVHTDLKPANIMMDLSGNVKIMDFGIAQPLQGAGQGTSTLFGSPAYMAPEQVEFKRLDARTDIYAVGVVLYEMVTGSAPFVGETPMAVAAKQVQQIPQRPREVAPDLPLDAEAAILKCLEKDPAQRFQSVDELWAALRKTEPRPTISVWGSFVSDFRIAGNDLRRDLHAGVESARDFIGRRLGS